MNIKMKKNIKMKMNGGKSGCKDPLSMVIPVNGNGHGHGRGHGHRNLISHRQANFEIRLPGPNSSFCRLISAQRPKLNTVTVLYCRMHPQTLQGLLSWLRLIQSRSSCGTLVSSRRAVRYTAVPYSTRMVQP